MKKVFSTLLVAGMIAIYGCGPSAEEKAAMEKAKQDSIAMVQKAAEEQAAAEANAAAEKAKQDAQAAADMEKARADSMAAAAKKMPSKSKKK